MAQTIKLKRSSVSGNVPSTGQLELGELAINTHDGKVFIKKDDGTASIVEVGLSTPTASVYSKYTYTATASQTTFSGTDDSSNSLSYFPGYAEVYLNGVKLLDTTEYTATNGSSIVLAAGASADDVLEVIAMGSGSLEQLIVTRGFDSFIYTATASQTTFSGTDDNSNSLSYTANQIQVFLNGVLLDPSDYTASNGTSVVISSGTAADDIVTILAYNVDSLDSLGDLSVDGNITVSGTVDGRDIATDGTKLDGIESGATADQTATEILTAIKTVDGAASGLDADLLDGQQGSYYTSYTDTAISNLVDSAPGALDTLNELAAALGDDANFSTTVTNSIALKAPLASPTFTGTVTADGLSLGDNEKATFGVGNDLEIYHDGSNSFITDAGTGDLKIQGANVRLENPSGVRYFQGSSGVSYLYNSGDIKLNTTSTGIDVTGTVTADDKINIDASNNSRLNIKETTSTDQNTQLLQTSGDFLIRTVNDAETVATNRIALDHATGDISFYEDTGTTPKLLWDASAEVLTSNVGGYWRLQPSGAASSPAYSFENDADTGMYRPAGANNTVAFSTAGTERMRIDSSGNLLVGKSASSFTTAGVELAQGGVAGKVQIQRSSSPLALANLTDDGSILGFYKGTAAVGSIGTQSGDLVIHSTTAGHAGIRFANGTFLPTDNSGVLAPNSIDIGSAANSFKDAHFSGTVNANAFAGDGSGLTGIDSLPSQTGNDGKYLTTDGTNPSWQQLEAGVPYATVFKFQF